MGVGGPLSYVCTHRGERKLSVITDIAVEVDRGAGGVTILVIFAEQSWPEIAQNGKKGLEGEKGGLCLAVGQLPSV